MKESSPLTSGPFAQKHDVQSQALDATCELLLHIVWWFMQTCDFCVPVKTNECDHVHRDFPATVAEQARSALQQLVGRNAGEAMYKGGESKTGHNHKYNGKKDGVPSRGDG